MIDPDFCNIMFDTLPCIWRNGQLINAESGNTFSGYHATKTQAIMALMEEIKQDAERQHQACLDLLIDQGTEYFLPTLSIGNRG